LVRDALITFLEAMVGFIVGVSSAFALGAAFVHSRILERSIAPYFVALQAVPIVATAPLLIIWFGNGLLSKVIMAAMICFFPMVINTTVGLKDIPEDALDLMRMLSASRRQIFLKLRLPASLPFIFSGLKISATLSVIGAVVAELAGATQGIGFQIMVSSYRTDTPMLFAAVLFSALTGILFYYAVVAAERLWQRHSRV
jgi:NitT/TauT family transport system permease protein